MTGVEGLQVSFVADVADEVGESLLLDAPQDAAHHRRHGYRRHDDSLAGPERRRVRWKLVAPVCLRYSVRPARLGSARLVTGGLPIIARLVPNFFC